VETKGLEFGLNHTLVQIKWKHHLSTAAVKSQFIGWNREKLTDS